ncbi:hypothetical protein EO95_14955 [Methanosarcina sp. 1.H.T.1A.1]|uniref:DEAD/DEAH box helicase n=1 Tax=Methanosarcina sp. 1.H.T.1A.1 TaxID=1483602 RepID=UPI000621E5D1|nr:DEAD/DEAH box helicase [Methanosarcina sp. 1.H.T.1A.1]KKH98501.1 hypothetical protein EO95_14955 [Methanosarcina sp. 1.H.T.1A.1]
MDVREGNNYSLLENFVLNASLEILGKRFQGRDFFHDYFIFRRETIYALHPFLEEQKINLLKKIAIESGLKNEKIDEVSRMFCTGSSLFSLELYVQLNELKKFYEFFDKLLQSDEKLANILGEPKILIDLWDHQKEALQLWFQNGGKGIVEMATATGKTMVGLAAIQVLYKSRKKLNVLVLAHSKAILRQWRKEAISKLGLIADPNDNYNTSIGYGNKLRIEFNTMQTVYKNPGVYETDYLIVDEVHHGAGKEFRNALNVPCKWKMGLSATIEGGERESVLDQYLGKTVYEFTLEKAREKGIIPEFKLYIHKNFLDVRETVEFYLITEKIVNLLNFINSTQKEEIKLISNGKFSSFENLSDFVHLMANSRSKSDQIPAEWNSLSALLFSRRVIIHRSSPKIESAINLAKVVARNKKCVMFTMDIETCEKIYDSLSSYVNTYHVHSNLKEHQNNEELDKFKKCSNGVLIAPKMLDEGIDIPDAEIGINVSSSKTKLQLVQRMGRILRKKPGKKPVFHHFVALPQSFIDPEDSFNYLNDLAWIQDITLKMGITSEIYDADTIAPEDVKTIQELEKRSEEVACRYHAKYDKITSNEFGTIRIKSIVDSIEQEAKVKLINLLDNWDGSISDEQWIQILRASYDDESMVSIPNHLWLLIIAERKPENIVHLLQKYNN